MVTTTLKGVRHAGFIIPSLTFQSWTGIDQGTQADRLQTCHTNDSNFTSTQLLGINILCKGGHTRISLALEMAGQMHSRNRLHFAQENLSLLHQPAQSVHTHAFLTNWARNTHNSSSLDYFSSVDASIAFKPWKFCSYKLRPQQQYSRAWPGKSFTLLNPQRSRSQWEMSQTKAMHGTRYLNPNNIPVIRESKPT